MLSKTLLSALKEIGLIAVEGKSLHETEKAVRLRIDNEEYWVPKSVLEDWPDEDEIGDVLVQRWWAEQNELI